MAVHALRPALLPANTHRRKFNLALVRFTTASDNHAVLSDHSSIASELASGEALERALDELANITTPDHTALAIKLRLILPREGVPAALVESLVADVVALDRGARR